MPAFRKTVPAIMMITAIATVSFFATTWIMLRTSHFKARHPDAIVSADEAMYSTVLLNGATLRFSYPTSWGSVSRIDYNEDVNDPFSTPRQVVFTFANMPTPDACPRSVSVVVIRTDDTEGPEFRNYQTAVERVVNAARRHDPLEYLANDPPHLPFPARFWLPGQWKRLASSDGTFRGIRYLANVAQDIAPSIHYEALLVSADNRFVVEISSNLDCGIVTDLGDKFFTL